MGQRVVSVVIPTYNCGFYVTEAIDSVLAQTYPAKDIIVIDDGSTDDTPVRLRPYMSQIRYFWQNNQGVAAARNRGVQEARGDPIAFLDADDVWHPRKLELQLEALGRDSCVGLLGTRCFEWPASGYTSVSDKAMFPLEIVSWEQLVVRNVFTTSSVIVSRSLLDRVGPFDTHLHGPEDHDLWIRVAERAVTANLNLALTGYRNVPGSISKHAHRMEEGMRRVIRNLETRGAWRNRPLLRRKAYSVLNHRCAFMYSEAREYGTAFLRSIKAIFGYPFPYRRDEVRQCFERPRQLISNGLRLLGLK